ncbi:hypothetical protein [Paraburkholderia sp. GAS334]|uniref:hypothetical protein n=1 Tax=Paraburkholderia sp. GAS334 TaxID=3035131 RepID=UPI003D24AA0D
MVDINVPHATSTARGDFDAWPCALQTLLDGMDIESKGSFTASLLAVDESARVRTSLLSVGELFVPDAHALCFALWSSSRTARAVHSTGRAALTFVFDEAFYQLQLNARPVSCGNFPLTCFVATIEAGESQRVDYARLTTGISFQLQQHKTVIERWYGQVQVLKRLASMHA